MTTDNDSQGATQPTAGKRLRQAREVAGLSVAEVAAKQHLRPAVISAIESGDYRSIDSELFLKGYVRAYATHVGIDPDSVIRQLDQELEPLREEQKAKVEASPLVTIERRKRRKQRIAKIVVVLVALAIAFYLGSLYLAGREAPTDPVTGDVSPAEADDGAATEAATATQADDGSPAVTAQEPSLVTREEAPDAGAEMVVEADGEPVTEAPASSDADSAADQPAAIEAQPSSEAAGNRAPVADGTPAGAASAEAPVQEADTVATAPLQQTQQPESAGGDGRLVVEFTADCWVEVQNSAGRTLVAQLYRPGETLDLTGDGPLRVVIGAVSAVSSIRYGGEPVDLSERRTRNDRVVLNLSD